MNFWTEYGLMNGLLDVASEAQWDVAVQQVAEMVAQGISVIL